MRRFLSALTVASSAAAPAGQAVNIADERFVVYVPAHHAPHGYGLIVFISLWQEAGVSRYWLPDSHSVWANGELTVGHDNIVARYAKAFKDGVFLSGLRTPQHIEVANGGSPDAAEVGTWKWKMHYSGHDLTWSGRYLAMWHKVDGQWGLRSDLYVVTRCTGGNACR